VPGILEVLVLVVFHLRRLEHTRNACGSRPLGLLALLRLELLLLKEKLSVVTSRELLELNEEVAEGKLEAVEVRVVLGEIDDELLNLGTERKTKVSMIRSSRDHL
jgi:hypothetical protein